MKEEIQDHPADVLAKALDRANGLLCAIGQLYDASRESFSGGNSFIAMSLSTSIELVSEARAALDELQFNCDLSLLNTSADNDSVMEVNFTSESASQPVEPEPIVETFAEDRTPITAVASLPVKQDEIARTYLELLQKLTAAEVFAVEQQALSVPGSSPELLPLLRSLREDIEKIHSAA